MGEDYIRALAYGMPPAGEASGWESTLGHATDDFAIDPRGDSVPAAKAVEGFPGPVGRVASRNRGCEFVSEQDAGS